jgi:hypothetical protein
MARIKNNLTGDVFEAPARDFASEADFTIVDSSTPVTAEPPVAASASGESDTPASAPAEQASSGTTDTPDATPSTDLASTQIDPTISTTPASTSTSTPDGTAPSAQGEAGNVSGDTSSVSPQEPGSQTNSQASTISTGGEDSAPSSSQGEAGNVAADAPASAITPAEPTSSPSTSADAKPGTVASQSSEAEVSDPATLNPVQPPVTDSTTGNPTGGPTPGNGATLDAKGKHIVADQLEADMLFAIAQIITPTDSIKHAADAFFDQVRSQIDVEAAQ